MKDVHGIKEERTNELFLWQHYRQIFQYFHWESFSKDHFYRRKSDKKTTIFSVFDGKGKSIIVIIIIYVLVAGEILG